MPFDCRNAMAPLLNFVGHGRDDACAPQNAEQPAQPAQPILPNLPAMSIEETIQSVNHRNPADRNASMDALFGSYSSPEVAEVAEEPSINWTTDDNPIPDMRTAADYNIQTMVDPETGQTIITSDNIRMEVAPLSPEELEKMGLPSDPEEMNAMLEEWRAQRNADDQMAYDMTSEEILERSKEGDAGSRYFDSEQHLVWAQAASARTGGQIPPEFFMEFDPYGGTAGNGPNILPVVGGAGQVSSTIAMGHDADWDLGRYMGVGPLAGLHDLNPTDKTHMEMMGSVGLFDAGHPLGGIRWPELHWPWESDSPQHQAALAEDARIAEVRNSVPYYSNGLFNNQANSDWNVQYTPEYIHQHAPFDQYLFPEENLYRK